MEDATQLTCWLILGLGDGQNGNLSTLLRQLVSEQCTDAGSPCISAKVDRIRYLR